MQRRQRRKDKEEEKPADSAKAKDDEMPAWFKPYAEDLQSIKKEKTQTTLRQQLEAKMKEKNIPMVFAKGRTLEKEEDIEALVTELEADPEVKALIEPVVTTRRPLSASGGGNGKPTDAEVDGILSKII
jgi:ClpP class serine protease